MQHILFLWLFVGLAATSQAETPHCGYLEDAERRAGCYRNYPEQNSTSKRKGWYVLDYKSTVDAGTNVIASVTSSGMVMCGDVESTATILINCKETQMSVVVSTGCPSQQGLFKAPSEVVYQVGDSPPTAEQFAVGSNERALAVQDHAKAIAFTQSLMSQQQLVMRIQPVGFQAFHASFEIGGLEKQPKLALMQRRCSW